jgi:methylase of polypeptide subunit release factors
MAPAPAARRSSRGKLHAELGTILRERGYSEQELQRVLGAPADRVLDPDYRPLAARRIDRESDPLAALAALLLLGLEVDSERVRIALAPLDLDRLADAGLISPSAEGVRARVRVLPYEGLLLACDLPGERDASFEEVTAPGPSARTLVALTVRRRVDTALDLGSGGGVQGLLLARHADSVVLSDVSARARAMAALNAQLNGVENLELRTGDWFEPVAGQRFDLVSANLPYVVSPDVSYAHRDNVLERDALSRSIVGGVGAHLNEGGFAHVLCNWVHDRGEEWANAPLAWVSETGCDALILHYASHEPLSYAASWNRPLQRTDPVAYEATLKRWLDYYDAAGIEMIASGAVILRRRSTGRTWTRAIEVPDAPTGSAGEHVERLFAAQDELARLPAPEALLRESLRPAAGQRLDQAMVYADGSYVADAAFMRLRPGVGVVARIDPRVLPVVVGCDGRRSLGDLITRATKDLGAERAEVATLCFSTVLTAIELGLVVFAGAPTTSDSRQRPNSA